MFYLLLLILLGLVYFFILPADIKRFLNIYAVLGGITLFVAIIIGLVFQYHYNFFEILFYLAAMILIVQCVRELEKL